MEEENIENRNVEQKENIINNNLENIEANDTGENKIKEKTETFIGDTRGETNVWESERLINERKEKIIKFLKNKQLWVICVLILAVILGIYIRSMPMHDHSQGIISFPKFIFMPWTAFGGTPGLWDITTNTWTLGPDLDPWVFERYAKIIVEQGKLPNIDMTRNVPIGFDTTTETQLLPYMIVGTYYLANIFLDANIEYAANVFPVIAFVLTIIVFFLFVREIFVRKSKESKMKANLIASISTFFMIVTPAFLSRTLAGIPEKESAAFLFMFLAFYLFLKAWKSETLKSSTILGVLAGISTALMILIWGGVFYVFGTIAITSLIAFILNKTGKKEFILYSCWIFFSFTIALVFSNRVSLKGMIISTDSGLAFLVFFIFFVHFILWDSKLIKNKFFEKINIPKNIVSIIVSIILIFILAFVFLGPSFIIEKAKSIHQLIFKPSTGRWGVTVAENRQPYFTEWEGSFGPHFKDIAITFWLFFIGSIVLFKKMLDKIKKKDSWILTGLYVLFFIGMVFSRYSGASTFNGENFISKALYYVSVLLLVGALIYYYNKYHKEKNDSFEKIDYEILFLFSYFVLCLFTARAAIRLIMVLATSYSIFVAFLIVEPILILKKTKGELEKILLTILIILILILSGFAFWTFYNQIKVQSYYMIPSPYNQQWQKAMSWVRENTAEDAVFAHWWDYGYWVQSIGNRPTVLDGGNAIVFWNYWMGRLVLTGDNQKDALDFLYSHEADYLLIDSTDIGKYTAFSSIGSDENYDRYSWFGTFLLDEKQIQETKDKVLYFYSGGVALDEDIMINENGNEILLPGQRAGIGAIVLTKEKTANGDKFGQPYIIAVYQGKQHNVNLRYLFINGQIVDFGSGIEATAYIFPQLVPQGQGITQNPIGAAIFISPRLMRGMLSHIYLLEDSLNKYPNFELVHSEQSLMVDSLNNQGMNLPDFIYYQGIQGPIKIWKINYSGDEEVKEEYLERDASKYLNWRL